MGKRKRAEKANFVVRNAVRKCAVFIVALCVAFTSANVMTYGNVQAAVLAGGQGLSAGNAADDFDIYCYWADQCLNPESVTYKDIENFMKFEMPSNILVEIARDNGVFQKSVAAWKGANYIVDPSKIAQGSLDEKGYYEAIIFSVFMAQTSDEQYGYEFVKKMHAETNGMLSQISNWVKKTDGLQTKVDIKNGKIKNIPANDKKKIKEYLEKSFSEDHPLLSDAGKIGDAVDDVLEVADTLSDAVEKMVAFTSLSEVPEGIKDVIRQMARMCPVSNVCMQGALAEAALSVENAKLGIDIAMLDVSEGLTVSVVGDIFDEWWHGVLESNPYTAAFMGGAKLGIFISNMLFSTDKNVEEYVKMECLGAFFSLLRTVKDTMESAYGNLKNTQNARNYLTAVQAMYTTGKLSCDFAIAFGKVVYEDALMSVFAPKDNYDEYVKMVNSYKTYYVNDEKTFQTNFWGQLEVDYPEIYDVYVNGKADTEQTSGAKILHSGVSGDLEWSIDADGLLTIRGSGDYERTYAYDFYSDGSVMLPEWCCYRDEIKKAKLDVSNITDAGRMFFDCSNLESVDTSGLDMKSLTTTKEMFMGCRNLESLDVGKWDVGNVTDMSRMFDGCISLKSLAVGKWDVGNVTDMSCMFGGCISLKSLDIGRWDVRNVTDMYMMFDICISLKSLDIGRWDVRNVTDMSAMFDGCISLKSLDIGRWDVGNVTDMFMMFNDCSSLTSLAVGKWDVGNVTCMLDMFGGCSNLKNLDISKWNVGTGVDIIYMFQNCSSLKKIDISRWKLKKVGSYAFSGCKSLTKIDIPANVTSIGKQAFYNCKKLKSITIKTSKLTAKRIDEDAFKGTYAKATVKAPAKVLSKYKKLLYSRGLSKKATFVKL